MASLRCVGRNLVEAERRDLMGPECDNDDGRAFSLLGPGMAWLLRLVSLRDWKLELF